MVPRLCKNMPAKQLRSFCFTWNNYTEEDLEKVRNYKVMCRYLVFGLETGESGTPHIQGYCQLINRVAFNTLKKLFPKMHIEETRGTPEEASTYCKKDGVIEEFGELGTTAKGADKGGAAEKARWQNVIEMAKKGDLDAIAESDPSAYLRMYGTLRQIAKDHLPKVDDLPTTTGLWIYGPSGVGKSRSVRQIMAARNTPIYDKPINKWWDGYSNEPCVLIDDFDKTHAVLGHYLKRWGDHYAFTCEIKGGALRIRPKIVIVTSQYSIEQIWEDHETRDAIKRRFKVQYLDNIETALVWREGELKDAIEFNNEHNLELANP